jgi:phage repressor protein C with HTH and peptisase S24 domain
MTILSLTQTQAIEASNLKKLFNAWQKQQRALGMPSSQEAVSDKLGFNQSSLSQYLNGNIPLNPDAATKFANLMDCLIEDFSPTIARQMEVYMKATQPSGPGRENHDKIQGGARVVAEDEWALVPIKRMNFKLRAGIMGLDADIDMSDGGTVQISKEALRQLRLEPESLWALPVRGQSMEPMLFEDDLVVVDTSDKRLVSRELYAVVFDGDACVKQVIFRGGEWYLSSLNPDFAPVNIRSGRLDVIGRVVYQPGRVITGRL